MTSKHDADSARRAAVPVAERLDALARAHWGELLASINVRLRNIQFAEDMLQEAILSALTDWARNGVPTNQKAWLHRAAMNKAIDRKRSQATASAKEPMLVIQSELQHSDGMPDEDRFIADERLRMIFTCCHPAIDRPAQLALTLRTLCGLRVSEIARAFLVSETTMARRLVRTKKKIRHTRIPYVVPEGEQLHDRLDAVLGVVYLIFNEGYSATSGDDPIRGNLCLESRYLAGCLVKLLPDQAEVHGLMALLLLHDSRREARLNASGELLMLEDQDRTLWDRRLIAEGFAALHRAASLRASGPYQLQAAISAVHAQTTSAPTTRWSTIVALYDQLLACHATPVVALNRAVAVSRASGPKQGLTLLQQINCNGALDTYQPFHAARADMHARLGDVDASAKAFERAIELSDNEREREYLDKQLQQLCRH